MEDRLLELISKYLGPYRFTGDRNIQLKCPFHKSGEEQRPSFSISLTKGLYHCFTCGCAGSLKFLFQEMRVPKRIADAALAGIKFEVQEPKNQRYIKRDRFKAKYILPNWILRTFHHCPVHLVEAGFDEELLEEYEVGVDQHHMRVTWPVRDLYGNLAGVSGGRVYSNQEPKYLVYKSDTLLPILGSFLPQGYDFRNHDHLWNAHRLAHYLTDGTEAPVVVTEGYKAALWIIQAGYGDTVATQTTILSRLQMDVLLRVGRAVYLFLDNDMPGKEGTYKNGKRLIKHLPVRIVEYGKEAEPDAQPDDMEPEEIWDMLDNAVPLATWIRRNRDVVERIQRAEAERSKVQPRP